jgi:hypothetical protein
VPFGPSPEQPKLFPPAAPAPPGNLGPVAPELPPARLAVTSGSAPRPLWKKWPFWAAVAGSVLITGTIAYSVTRDEPLCGAGCTQLNFR